MVAHGGSTRYSITTQFFSDPDFNKVRNINPKVNQFTREYRDS